MIKIGTVWFMCSLWHVEDIYESKQPNTQIGNKYLDTYPFRAKIKPTTSGRPLGFSTTLMLYVDLLYNSIALKIYWTKIELTAIHPFFHFNLRLIESSIGCYMKNKVKYMQKYIHTIKRKDQPQPTKKNSQILKYSANIKKAKGHSI